MSTERDLSQFQVNQEPTKRRGVDVLDMHIQTPSVASLELRQVDHIPSIGHNHEGQLQREAFNVAEGKVHYPQKVLQALAGLYTEYNHAFTPLVVENSENDTDYQHIMKSGEPINGWVQIDMVGLPDGFLHEAEDMTVEEVTETLRGRIFEIENSLARYNLMQGIFQKEDEGTRFDTYFRASLDEVRQKTGKKIALLAVTDSKHEAMMMEEFGKSPEAGLTEDETFEISGFNKFFGPEEFLEHLKANNGESQYLLYVRSSDPISKLRKPKTEIESPLLADPDVRRVIKANSLTFNIDDPSLPNDSPKRINDTKAYMPRVGMGIITHSDEDIHSEAFIAHLHSGKPYSEFEGQRYTEAFNTFLESRGISPEDAGEGKINFRAKPAVGAYGCYGHTRGPLTDKVFRQEHRKGMRDRGPYVIQTEMTTPTLTNTNNGTTYNYIDRVFLTTNGEDIKFMGGFRTLLPAESEEVKKGRLHGNGNTVWQEISYL